MKSLFVVLSVIVLAAACSGGSGTNASSWKAAANGFADITIDCAKGGDLTMKWHLVETNEKYSFGGKCKMDGTDTLELQFSDKPPQMQGKSVQIVDANTYRLKIFKPSTQDANIEIGGVLLYRK